MRALRKVSGRRGTTLAEMLVAVLILMFLTLVTAGGTGLAVKTYRTERSGSDSRILANSLFLAMTEELRYATGITVSEDGMAVTYDSRTYGADTVMEIEQGEGKTGGIIRLTYDRGEGKAEGKTAYLYQETVYLEYRICAREGRPVFETMDDSVAINFDICDSHGNVKTSLEDVRIRLLNGG